MRRRWRMSSGRAASAGTLPGRHVTTTLVVSERTPRRQRAGRPAATPACARCWATGPTPASSTARCRTTNPPAESRPATWSTRGPAAPPRRPAVEGSQLPSTTTTSTATPCEPRGLLEGGGGAEETFEHWSDATLTGALVYIYVHCSSHFLFSLQSL